MINKLMKGFKKNNKGFTLVELMVVVVIIGILVAIAVPVYNASQKTARVNADKANVRILNGALTQWAAENEYDLADLPTGKNDYSAVIGELKPKYIQEEPQSPFEGGSYILVTKEGTGDDEETVAAYFKSSEVNQW